jgi:hypothetical protein
VEQEVEETIPGERGREAEGRICGKRDREIEEKM